MPENQALVYLEEEHADHFFCFVHILGEVVVCALRGQTAHLPPVVYLVSIADETNNCSVICKLNEEVLAVR